MMKIDGFLKSIEKNNESKNIQRLYNNNDHNLGEVLKLFASQDASRELTCLDGSKVKFIKN